ncbi:Glycosyltransferase involved in cell wall bisynthesis [Chitinophaga costaii]|uniref:Glycosyltransferase involved in cell wall bisynthesis n=1 Tax=Chitinophaga costaii TaxID=1335309 RepID=A0A1C3ZB84_9BACT|nr:glycosyltransferase family 4 protein [Chitinophaga costaii]PUZ30303.1 glycosyltransferase family 1 protein [Chitinophaga costaii]SCB79621.1 Glycosyltransferase involved in cell wall bisynthesis [Chitinophaga costaii]
MKILMVHNDYAAYSGEESYIDKITALFTAQGHEVYNYRKSTARARHSLLGTVQVFLSGIYAIGAARRMRQALTTYRPDVVNIHNLYPFISPAALFVCKKAGIPVVMTVHNYRLMCPTGLFLRNGRPCETCLQRGNEWGCVQHNCEHNMAKSLGYALRNYIARQAGAYAKNVDAFVCLSWFQRNRLIDAGFAPDKLFVIPNFLPVMESPREQPGQYVGFAGRPSHEKGWDMLVEIARRHPAIPFQVAGEYNTEQGGALPPNIQIRGFLRGENLRAFYRQARFLVVPSRCYEGFPNVALEAMSVGTPVIAPHHGAFPEILLRGKPAGMLFMAGNTDDLERKLLELWDDAAGVAALGANAWQTFNDQFTGPIAYRKWQGLLQNLTHNHK